MGRRDARQLQRPRRSDETYIGGLEKNKHASKKLNAGRGPVGKTAVVAAKDRDSNRVAARVIAEVDGATLNGFVDAHAGGGAAVYTDGSTCYKGRENHESVAHSVGEYVRYLEGVKVHTNGVESFWSMLKRATREPSTGSAPSTSSGTLASSRTAQYPGHGHHRPDGGRSRRTGWSAVALPGVGSVSRRGHPTEVDAYVFIKNTLKSIGWGYTKSRPHSYWASVDPERMPRQPRDQAAPGVGKTENIVKVSDTVLWVIEAKGSLENLSGAMSDAYGRTAVLNESDRFQVMFVSGVAGNHIDGFVTRTEYLHAGEFRPITWNGTPVTGLLRYADLLQVLEYDTPDVRTPKIDEALFLARANAINEELHLGAVNPHQRASVMAALLLSMLTDTGPNIAERSPSILIEDINSRVRSVLMSQGKPEFYDYIRIALPHDNG